MPSSLYSLLCKPFKLEKINQYSGFEAFETLTNAYGSLLALTMSALLESSLFYAKTHSGQPTRTNELRKDQTRSNSLCKKGSIAALIEFTRNPVETLGSAVGDWYDGSTKEKKEGRTLANARKQVLYLNQRNASPQCR